MSTEGIIPVWISEYDTNIRPTAGWNLLSNVKEKSGSGCALDCIYCNQVFMNRGQDRSQIPAYLSPIDGGVAINQRLCVNTETVATIGNTKLIEELKNYPYFSKITPLIIDNFSDPGLDWTHSIKLASEIQLNLKHNGPYVFITKMPISKQHVEEFKNLQKEGGKPIVIVTYSEMPESVEKASNKRRVQTIHKLSEAKIPVIVSIRPIITDINDSTENFRLIARNIKGSADAIIFGGLFVDTNYTIEAFQKAGIALSESYLQYKYSRAKLLSPEVKTRLRETFKSEGVVAPIYEHTTCAVAYVETNYYKSPTPNKMAWWTLGKTTNFGECGVICPSIQIAECQKAMKLSDSDAIQKANAALDKLNIYGKYNELKFIPSEIERGTLLIEGGALNIHELMPIMEACGRRVDNLPDRDGFLYRSKEALRMYLNVSDLVVVDAKRIGQEWLLIVTHDLTNDDNELSTKYLRTNARCRCNVVSINKYLRYLSPNE